LGLLATGTVVLLALVVALYLGGATWVVNRVLGKLKLDPQTTIRSARVTGNLLTALQLHDVRLTRPNGEIAFRLDSLAVRYDPRELLSGDIFIREARLVAPNAILSQFPDGSWDLFGFRKRPSGSPRRPGSPPPRITIGRVSVSQGKVQIRFSGSRTGQLIQTEDLRAEGSQITVTRGIQIGQAEVGIRFRSPNGTPDWSTIDARGSLGSGLLSFDQLIVRSPVSAISARGTFPLPRSGRAWDLSRLGVQLSARPLTYSDLTLVSPGFKRPGDVALTLDARGEGPAASVRLNAGFSDGGSVAVEGILTPPGNAPAVYRAKAMLRRVDPRLISLQAGRGEQVSGDLTVGLEGPTVDRLNGQVRLSIRDSRYAALRARRGELEANFTDGRARVNLDLEGKFALGARGWLRPFDSVPSYDLGVRVGGLPHESSPGWWNRLFGRGGTRLLVQVKGQRFSPRRADLQALLTVRPGAGPAGLLDSGSARIRLKDGTAQVRARVGATGGQMALTGRVTLAKELAYRIDQGSATAMNIAAILGSNTASSLTGDFSLSGQGTGPKTMNGRANLSIASAAYGRHQLVRTRLGLRLVGGVVNLSGEAILDGASLDLDANFRPFSKPSVLGVERVRFRHLDIARFLPGTGIPTDLTGLGTLRAEGLRLNTSRATGRIVLDQSRIGAESLESGTITTTLSRGDLGLQLQLSGAAGRVDLGGTARPFDSIPDYAVHQATFRELDLGRLLGLTDLHTGLAGTFRLEGAGRKPEDARLHGMLALGASTVNRAAIDSARLDAKLAQGRLNLVARVAAARDSVTIDAFSEPFRERPRVGVQTQIAVNNLAAWLNRDSLDAGGEARLKLEGEWRGRNESAQFRGAIHGNGHWSELSLDTLQAVLRMAHGTLEVDTLAVHSNVGDVTGMGSIVLFGRGTGRSAFRLAGKLSRADPLGPLLGINGLGLDSGRVTALLEGTRESQRIQTQIQARNLVLGPRRARTVQASLKAELDADHSIVSGAGDLVLERVVMPNNRIGRVRVRSSYNGQELALKGEAELDAFQRAWLAARVYPHAADRRVELDTLEVINERERWQLSHPVRVTYGDRLQVDDFSLTTGGRRVAVNGLVDPRGEQSLKVRIDSIPAGWLTQLAGIKRLDGEINGSLDLTGPAAKPHVTGDVAIGLRSEKKPVGNARGQLDWVGTKGLHLDLGLYHRKGDSLRITGEVPLGLSLATGEPDHHVVRPLSGSKLALDAKASDFPIDMLESMFDPATVKTIRGRLSMDAHARGTLDEPALSGGLDLSDATIRIASLGASYEKGRLKATFHGDTIRLDQARFETGKGSLQAQGTATLGQSSKTTLDIQGTLQEFQLADGENLRSNVSGKVRLGGTAAEPLLAGAVDLRNLDFYLQAKDLSGSAEPVELTPADLSIIEDRFGLPAGQPIESRPSRWALNLDLTLAGNDWLRRRTSPAVAVELSGKLGVRKESGQELQVFGAIQPLPGRSFVELLGRRFEVTSGEVGLNGPVNKTRLTLNAEYKADSIGTSTSPSGVVITTRVSVDTGQLVVTMGSRPTLSAADIKSYLATGRPAGTDPTTKSDESNPLTAGASLAVGAALGSVAGGAGRKLGFDVVQILQDRNGGQTLVAGKYVSPPLYLGFREPIVAPNDPTEPEAVRGTMEWEVEYAALERALLNLQGSSSEFRVFLRLRR
jgi:translocation and assembly module TamB